MAWCPKCKNEYREGITVCAECGCELVEEKEISDMRFLTGGEDLEQWLTLKGFLEYSGISYVEIRSKEPEQIDEYENTEEAMCLHALYVKHSELQQAQKIARVFFQQKVLEKMAEEQENSTEDDYSEFDSAGEDDAIEDNENLQPGEPAKVTESADEIQNTDKSTRTTEVYQPYIKSEDQAEENRSSAWTLLIVGTLGIIAVALGIAGIIPFRLGNPYMFYGVMSAVFILFVVMGLVSMKNAKIFAKKAESENSLRNSLLKWCRENLTAEKVDEKLATTNEIPEHITDGEMYFKRYDMIKQMVNHQFMNLDQGLLENLIDEEVYDMVFPNNENE